MNFNKTLLNCLCYQKITVQAKFLWVLLESQNKNSDGYFQLSISTWVNLLDISPSNLKRQLKELNDHSLIKREYRSDSSGGNKLFIKIIYPENLDNMTFLGFFDGYEERLDRYGNQTIVARFKDLLSLNNKISLKYTWCDLTPEDENTISLKKVDVESYISFKCKVKVTLTSFYLYDIHNIIKLKGFNGNGEGTANSHCCYEDKKGNYQQQYI